MPCTEVEETREGPDFIQNVLNSTCLLYIKVVDETDFPTNQAEFLLENIE